MEGGTLRDLCLDQQPAIAIAFEIAAGRLDTENFLRSGSLEGVTSRSDLALLEDLLDRAMADDEPTENALDLFIETAKVRPFSGGNKRTALFTANALLLGKQAHQLLTIPVDEQDPSVADRFNDMLARAYVHNGHDGARQMLCERGISWLPERDADWERLEPCGSFELWVARLRRVLTRPPQRSQAPASRIRTGRPMAR